MPSTRDGALCLVLLATALVVVEAPCGTVARAQDRARPDSSQLALYGFGRSVAAIRDLNGDGLPDVLVGCPDSRAETIRRGPGAVFAYSGADGTLLLRIDGKEPRAYLGVAVADAGDVDKDGVHDIIAGAPYACPDEYASFNGQAFVFSGKDGHVVLSFKGAKANDRAAWSVSGAGDFNGDGHADLLVGSPWATPGDQAEAGCIQVLSGVDGKVLFTRAGTTPEEWLGLSVAAGDLNGDGVLDFVAGATGYSPEGVEKTGRVVAYSGKDCKEMLSFRGTQPGGRLGFAVRVTDDFNGDGFADVVAGAPFANAGPLEEAGRVLVASGKDGSQILSLDGKAGGLQFGWSLASARQAGKNAQPSFLAGTPWATVSGRAEAGQVTVHTGKDGSTVRTINGEQSGDWFGQSVATIADLNRDGVEDLLVGAEYANNGVGRVVVVSGKDGTTIRVLAPPAGK